MMKRIIILTSILIFTIYFTGCNKTEELDQITDNSYEISTIIYTEEDDNNNISIEYPKVSGLSDEAKQKTINDMIKAEALKVYDDYNYEDRGHLSLDIEYNITLKNGYILSIQYFGLGDVEMAPHPHKLFYTTNIDMKMGNRLRLVDLVNIKEKLINMFINGEFKPLWPEQEEVALSNYGTYDVAKESLINADSIDNMGSVFSYLTNDTLGISIPAAHAIGGHAEFEIKYKDIAEYLKDDSEGWKEFMSNTEE